MANRHAGRRVRSEPVAVDILSSESLSQTRAMSIQDFWRKLYPFLIGPNAENR